MLNIYKILTFAQGALLVTSMNDIKNSDFRFCSDRFLKFVVRKHMMQTLGYAQKYYYWIWNTIHEIAAKHRELLKEK